MQQLQQDQQEQKQQRWTQQEFLKRKGERPLHRLHWLASEGLCLISRASPDVRVVRGWLRMEVRSGPGEQPSTAESDGSGPAASFQSRRSGPLVQAMGLHGLPCQRITSVHADFNWKAWRTYSPTVQEATSLPAAGSGNTKRKQYLDVAGPAVCYSNPAICERRRCHWLLAGCWRSHFHGR